MTLRTKRWHFEIFLKISKERKFHRDTQVDKNFPKVSPFRRKTQIFSDYKILKGWCQKVTLWTKRWHFENFLEISKERKFHRDTEVDKNFPKVSPFRRKTQILSYYTILKSYLKVILRTKRFEIFLKISKERKFHRDTEVDKNFPKVSPFRRKIQMFSYYTILRGVTLVSKGHLFDEKYKCSVIIQF